MRRFICIISIFLYTLAVNAQIFQVIDVDESNYPEMSAHFFAYDEYFALLHDFNTSDFAIYENDVKAEILSVECPVFADTNKLSIVLTIDVSSSMMTGSRLEKVKESVGVLIDSIPDKSELAITSFDFESRLVEDFSTDKQHLKERIATLKTLGGTATFDAAFTDPEAGALEVIKDASYKRMVILITDGRNNFATDVDDIIQQANDNNVAVYCIIIEAEITSELQRISEETGGAWFDNVSDLKSLTNILVGFYQINHSYGPCVIRWAGDILCKRQLELRIRWLFPYDMTYTTEFTMPFEYLSYLDMQPPYIRFKNIPKGTSVDTTIKVWAVNSDFDVSMVNTESAGLTIEPETFLLEEGDSLELKINYTAMDSNYLFASFSFENELCPQIYNVLAGSLYKNGDIRLLFPNGGEKFRAGHDTLISWDNQSNSNTFSLDYSTDAGKSWSNIVNDVGGEEYLWGLIPDTPSDSCLMKIYNNKSSRDNLVYTFEDNKRSIVSLSWSPDSYKLAVATFEHYVKIYDLRPPFDTLRHSTTIGNDKTSIFWTPDSNLIAYLRSGSSCQLRSPKKWNYERSLPIDFGSNYYYNSRQLQTSPNGEIASVLFIDDDNSCIIFFNITNESQYSSPSDPDIQIYAWAPDGTSLICGTNDTVRIFDAISGYEIRNLDAGRGNWNDIAISPDGHYLLGAGYEYYTENWCSIIDLEAGNSIHDFTEHDGYVLTLDWSANGERIATGSNDSTIRIWDAKSFECIDTIFTGSVPEIIRFSPDSRYLAATTRDMKTGIYDMQPYYPSDISDSLWAIISPGLDIRDIDMGDVIINTQKDSVLKFYIKNSGSCDILIDSVRLAGPDDEVFNINTDLDAVSLLVNDTVNAVFSFIPLQTVEYYSDIIIYSEYDTYRHKITGRGIRRDSLRLKVLSFSAEPGEATRAAIFIYHSGYLDEYGITHISGNLTFNASLLGPMEYIHGSKSSISGREMTIRLDSMPLPPDNNTVLTYIMLRAGLGDSSQCEIRLHDIELINFTPLEHEFVLDTIQGMFTLEGICDEGGKRLLAPYGEAASISVYPNPANDMAEIRFNAIEKGSCSITMTNILGENIRCLYYGAPPNGENILNIDLTGIAPGIYFITMKSATIMKSAIIRKIE